MRRFIRYIILFSLIILAFFMAGEWYVRSIPNPARYKHQWMLAHSTQVETLILGSSHCFYGIEPQILGPNAFSLAQPTQTYRYDLWELQRYPMPKLKTVILPFSYQSLFEDLESEPRLRYWAVRYRLYMDCPIHYYISQYGWECLHIPSFREKLTSLWRPPKVKWDSLGFGLTNGYQSLLVESKDNGLQRVKENTYIGMKSLALCTGELDSIASICDRRGINLVLFTSPTSESFRRYANQHQIDISRRVLRRVMARHPSISYYNYWADADFTPAHFYDADHLNLRGASLLTLKLLSDMRKSRIAHSNYVGTKKHDFRKKGNNSGDFCIYRNKE